MEKAQEGVTTKEGAKTGSKIWSKKEKGAHPIPTHLTSPKNKGPSVFLIPVRPSSTES